MLQALVPHRADPAFGEGVELRRAVGKALDTDLLLGEGLVEGPSELAVAVPKQDGRRFCHFIRRRGDEALGLFEHPLLIGLGGGPADDHTPALDVDKYQREVRQEPLPAPRLGREEIAGPQGAGVLLQELVPGWLAALGAGSIPCSRRMVRIVGLKIEWTPSLRSSPRIRP